MSQCSITLQVLVVCFFFLYSYYCSPVSSGGLPKFTLLPRELSSEWTIIEIIPMEFVIKGIMKSSAKQGGS